MTAFAAVVALSLQAQALVTTTHVNLRRDSLPGSAILRLLPPGTAVTGFGAGPASTGFRRVRLADGVQGWVYKAYLISAGAPATPCDNSCGGTERWAVKTATDPDAGHLDTIPLDATLDSLIGLVRPGSLPYNARVPTELRVFRVRGWLLGWKHETDADLHLVIADAASGGRTMIVELPDPHCRLACNSRFRGHFEAARATVIAQLGGAAGPPSGHFQRLTPPRLVVVTGVGFFDFLHGQTGVAPNGIELHPVLGIVFP